MKSSRIRTPRWIGGGVFLFGATASLVLGAHAVHAPPATALAGCTSGEEEDTFTTTCVPFLTPNAAQGFQPIPGNPDMDEIDNVPCTGGNAGECIGLGEEQEAMGPQPIPRSTISASP